MPLIPRFFYTNHSFFSEEEKSPENEIFFLIGFKNYSLAVNNFTTEADRVQMDLGVDNEESRRLQTQIKKWDRKKKKMITVNNVGLNLSSLIIVHVTTTQLTVNINCYRIRRLAKCARNLERGYRRLTRRIVTRNGRKRRKSTMLTTTMTKRSNHKHKSVS